MGLILGNRVGMGRRKNVIKPNGSPSLLTATGTELGIDLAWTNGSTNETGISIERSTDGISFVEISTVLSGISNYSDNDILLIIGNTYHYRVRAEKNGTHSNYTNVASCKLINAESIAFFAATGITDAAEKSATDELVSDLKSAGLWSKMKAVYPFIGGTASAHKFNLKDARDLDAAYRITWAGTVEHSATLGVKGNGIDGYGNTHLIPTAYDNIAFSVYSRDDQNTASGYEIGSDGNGMQILNGTYNSGVFRANSAWTIRSLWSFNNTKGLFSVSRLSNTLQHNFRNGNVFISETDPVSPVTLTNPLIICGYNNNGSFGSPSDRQISFICIGDGLTPYEEQLKYTIVRKYIDARDGNSIYNQQIQFESWQPSELNQVSMNLKVNYGHKVTIDWGEGVPIEYTGDGSNMLVTSNYSTESKTYYGRIYGELSELIRFDIVDEFTFGGLNVNDFRRLNIPLYSLKLNNIKGVIIDIEKLPLGLIELSLWIDSLNGYGSANNVPKYLGNFESIGTAGYTMDNLTSLPTTLGNITIGSYTRDDINIDNLPITLEILNTVYVNNLKGSIKNLPASIRYMSIIGCGGGVDIAIPPMKPWANTDIILTSGFTTANVDGFLNAWAQVAGNGVKTINLAGVDAGTANQARSAASDTAVTTLNALGKTIQTN